jgi:hypothetical protein
VVTGVIYNLYPDVIKKGVRVGRGPSNGADDTNTILGTYDPLASVNRIYCSRIPNKDYTTGPSPVLTNGSINKDTNLQYVYFNPKPTNYIKMIITDLGILTIDVPNKSFNYTLFSSATSLDTYAYTSTGTQSYGSGTRIKCYNGYNHLFSVMLFTQSHSSGYGSLQVWESDYSFNNKSVLIEWV